MINETSISEFLTSLGQPDQVQLVRQVQKAWRRDLSWQSLTLGGE
jgi:hypothetical protein